jgi:hypothetical protein
MLRMMRLKKEVSTVVALTMCCTGIKALHQHSASGAGLYTSLLCCLWYAREADRLSALHPRNMQL